MGVHDVDKYPQIKELLGIPETEPIFILRAQDRTAYQAIMHYQNMASRRPCSDSFIADLDKVLDAFSEWQDNNQTKLPD